MVLKEIRDIIDSIKDYAARNKRFKIYSLLAVLFIILGFVVPETMLRIYGSMLSDAENKMMIDVIFACFSVVVNLFTILAMSSDFLMWYEESEKYETIQSEQTEKNSVPKQPKEKKYKLCDWLVKRFAAIGRKIHPCLTNINVTVMDVQVRCGLDNANRPLSKAYISVHSNDYDLDYTAVFAFQSVFLPEKLSLQKGDVIPAIMYKNDANSSERCIKALVLENELQPAELTVQNYHSLPYRKDKI